MNKIIAAIVCTTCIASCSSSDISTVKNGQLDFNKTLTIGQALGNWENCEKSEWSEITSGNGVKVVQFECDEKMSEFVSTLQSFFPKNSPSLASVPSSDTKTFQFTMNKDGTFQLDNVSDLKKWSDGTENTEMQNPEEQIKSAYKNKMEYDVSIFNGLQGIDAAQSPAVIVLLTTFDVAKATGTKSSASQEASQESTPGAVPPANKAPIPSAEPSETTVSTAASIASPSVAKAPIGAAQEGSTPPDQSAAGTGAICEEGSNGVPALGSTYQAGIYLCREHVEGGYWNDWYASRSDPQKLHVESDGKTSGFSGVITINCSTGASSWADAKEFEEPLASDKDIAGVVPIQVLTNAKHYLCKG